MNTRQVKVHYSDVSTIQVLVIQIPTVSNSEALKISYVLSKKKLLRFLMSNKLLRFLWEIRKLLRYLWSCMQLLDKPYHKDLSETLTHDIFT